MSYLSNEFWTYIPIANFIGLPYFSGFPSALKSHVLISHDYLSQSKLLLLTRDHAAMCSRSVSKHQKKFCFVSKPVCMYCIQVRISCKVPLSAAFYVYCYLDNQFYVFQTAACGCLHSDVSIEYVTAPVSLTDSVFM